MPQQLTRSAGRSDLDTNKRRGRSTEDRAPDEPGELLDLLGDDYARSAIEAIRDEPMSGAEVAAATDMSRPTAFRRLNDLADLGLVAVRRRIDPEDGYHSKVYELVVDSLSVDFGSEDVAVSVQTDSTPESSSSSRRGADSPRARMPPSD